MNVQIVTFLRARDENPCTQGEVLGTADIEKSARKIRKLSAGRKPQAVSRRDFSRPFFVQHTKPLTRREDGGSHGSATKLSLGSNLQAVGRRPQAAETAE